MKKEKQEQAKALRRKGISINKIAKDIHAAKSSVSLWVRDIELTQEQKQKLYDNIPRWKKGESHNYVYRRAAQCKKKREEWQEEGKRLAQQNNKMYAFCCALFWGEGSKARNQVSFTNTDVNMMKIFMSFLRDFFDVSNEKITLTVNCYLNDKTLDEIKEYWCKELLMNISCFRKCTIKSKYYTPPKKIKYPYGVCRIRVNSTEILQKIYGSIKYFAKDNSDNWLN